MLKGIFKDIFQQMLEAEIGEHLGYEKHSLKGDNSGNSRNGYSKKTIKTKIGKTEIDIPRDRNGQFEPEVVFLEFSEIWDTKYSLVTKSWERN